MTIYTWTTIADDNDNADYPYINWREFQEPDTVNNSARGMMARVAAWRDDNLPRRVSTGSADAYVITAAAAPDSFSTDFVVWWRADRTNTGVATLKVNSLPTKPLRAKTVTGLAPGEIQAGTVVGAYYVAATDEFLLVNSGFHASTLVPQIISNYAVGMKAGMIATWAGASLPAGYLWCDGSAVSRSEYSELFAAIGTRFGAGNETTTFNLPDSRGRGEFGRDDMGGTAANRITSAGSGIDGTVLGATGGHQALNIARANLPNVNMTGTTSTDGEHFHKIVHGRRSRADGSSGTDELVDSSSGAKTFDTQTAGNHYHTVTVNLNGNVTQIAYNKVPPALIVNKIILAKPADASGSSQVPEFTVDGLPTTGPNIAIASNGRKNGEGVGEGTGVLCFRIGTNWYASDTGAPVEA